MATFKDIAHLESFSVRTVSENRGALYANGYQQLTIYVDLVPLDNNFNYITISDMETFKEHLDLVDYVFDTTLVYQRQSSNVTANEWCYTLAAGNYQELINPATDVTPTIPGPDTQPADVSEEAPTAATTITVRYYIICPPAVKERSIRIGAAFRLNSGERITTVGTSGFDSGVTVTAYEPIVYSLQQGLAVSTSREYATNAPYPLEDFVYLYHVYISSSQNPSGIMTNMVFYPEGDYPTNYNRWPQQLPGKLSKDTVKDVEYAFSGNIYARNRGVCYIYPQPAPENAELGMESGWRKQSTKAMKNAFNFASIHIVTSGIYNQQSLSTMICNFSDQFGNPGGFKAVPHYDANANYHASTIRFTDI